MKRNYKKSDFPVSKIRKFLEPGPVALISSHYKGKSNIMTQAWHTVLEFNPSLIGCMITASNHSFDMIRKSGECVINIPTVDLIDEIIGIGNSSGQRMDKFRKFGLTPEPAQIVKAPIIKECYANYECKIADASLLDNYNFFIFEVVRAQAATYPKYPRTVHYRGEGVFMVSGKELALPQKFKKKNL
ncbi:NADH-FMN oxidoreductase RutF, flavin reductase (DIM6/NTAB) family [Chitinophaga terrae (ex Kim and Jung 2007)]|uniref:NADH-FMN oxidoreductase RutF, flavin reductase (DIM6/NTAB) family n=1 Tax=Chitinophaga terrae (ex Kim and Jung 2007) TaxID=408074 RepID=A0A1H3YUA6_9BACT|nr:flavin reductase family protein [Chitinophaga terrae (ex Kim and Jung 2007)]GEP88510.1 flavin reductase [Chitinophaga terrae (ex Kim and Jung 2007)]SEA15139.1 NADH-FMN oxidoreductase RutF, flavin reductase (DIM6/NTAB) family [Chitinophaga terrae (ex Kim and Jung 2007)]